MTESKHDALYTAIRAHRDHLIEVTGRLVEAIENLRGVAGTLRRAQGSAAAQTLAQAIERECDALASSAVALGSGLESLHRTADATLDETQPMALRDLLDAADDPDT